MGKRGEIYILDMGEPVRILDLARDLIRLSGFRPDTDIKIEFTGIRPGEKLFEKLTYDEERMNHTAHEKIFVSAGDGPDPACVLRDVDRLIRLAAEGERDTLRDEILGLARSGFPCAAPPAAAPPAAAVPSSPANRPVKEVPAP
jgi:FlaA1/EpsC-like NDP-sugar epimerase